MGDKVSNDKEFNGAHDEKTPNWPPEENGSPDLNETAGRRKSVALNVVENPLKVSLSFSVAATSRGVEADSLHSP